MFIVSQFLWYNMYTYLAKLEAQWTEHVSLSFHFVFRKLYTEPSMAASYHV